ncbi:hypothetical protein CAPTEDRAFT_218061 [Capitella teleta]|uniref:Uncharacterized protein n=1 Tax=Capitella teleta TaxID=283909 RepID=R7TYF4_CAPTE|nr:hypothetical protein CAPTEDRAFT_218061 [Capitella teleta]|eukprot:ELT98933.1 hypothetical protein CAPTEDRAFT_218061 [Capitella teleta]
MNYAQFAVFRDMLRRAYTRIEEGCFGVISATSLTTKLITCFTALCVYMIINSGVYLYVLVLFEPPPPGPTAAPIFHSIRDPPSILLTLFTTLHPSEAKLALHHNTLRNWAQYRDRVHLIYYADATDDAVARNISETASQLGWNVRPVPKYHKNVPVLRHMFIEAQNISQTPYYGYANGDILFTNTLLDTLSGVYDYRLKNVLMVGRRTNVYVSKKDLVTSSSVTMQARNASLFMTNAQDYFITTSHGFPWETIPNFIVGRIGYDNWLVASAILRQIPVVDLTNTLLAVHQTDAFGNFAGHYNKTKVELHTNLRMVSKFFKYGLGHTKCAQFYTENSAGVVELKSRKRNVCERSYRLMRVNPNFFVDSIREYISPSPDINSEPTIGESVTTMNMS